LWGRAGRFESTRQAESGTLSTTGPGLPRGMVRIGGDDPGKVLRFDALQLQFM